MPAGTFLHMLCVDPHGEVRLGRALTALRGVRKLLNDARGVDGLLAQGVDLAALLELIEHEFATVIDPPRT